MPLYIYDSVQKQKREFISQEEGKATLYVCGPTVYDDAHLGHAKSALVFDLLARVLKANGYEVTYARNITDIDDKIINKAITQNKQISEITDFYTKAYHDEMASIGVVRPDLEPRATESLEAMFKLIEKLLSTSHAYKTDNGDIYFDTSSDSDYLTLSKRVQDEEAKVARVDSTVLKKNSADFALWKGVQDDGISFDSPFGKGRPGWHIECSAMIEKHLAKDGLKFAVDIHGGGADLLFPHHENEAAQTRCATNRSLAAYWMHNGFISVDGEKMSKSLGNSFFLKDALKIYDGEVLRFYLLSSHYRSNFNFSEEDLLVSKKRLDKLYRLKKRLFGTPVDEPIGLLEKCKEHSALNEASFSATVANAAKRDSVPFACRILEALNDDLNISQALALIDEMISVANEAIDASPKDKAAKQEALSTMFFIESTLGFGVQNPFKYFQQGVDEATKEELESLLAQRSEAKKAKDFARADALRDKITAFGVNIMDTAQGSFWERV